MTGQKMKLEDLKIKSAKDLLTLAEELEVENASTLRRQELMFAILKEQAEREIDIIGGGVLQTTCQVLMISM